MQEFLNAVWFSVGAHPVSYGQVIYSLGFVCVTLIVYWYFTARFLPDYIRRRTVNARQSKRVYRIINYILAFWLLMGMVTILDIDRAIFSNAQITFRLSTLIQALLIFQMARLIDWIISRVFIHGFYESRDKPRGDAPAKPQTEESANKTVQFAVYVFAVILILRSFQIDYEIYSFGSGNDEFVLKISNIFLAILVILIARIFVWVITQLVLYTYYKRQNVDAGSQYAFNQLLKYVVYVFAILIAITQLGVKSTLIWGGLAAVMVGVGLGLQQTFNDFFSGIILLFERSVEIGDILQLDTGLVGSVKKIGIRASILETRDNVTVVVPNSKLVTDNVINWSHYDDKVRFFISVSVAYGSDPQQIRDILLRIAKSNNYVIDFPAPLVRLKEFADSGVIYELHFWSRAMIIIEDIKSDIRIQVDHEFAKAGITIPFPQRDIWIRSKQEDPAMDAEEI